MQLLNYQLAHGVRAFSTLRSSGGSGEGTYARFNISPFTGDDVENIKKNRILLCQELKIEDAALILPEQTHGNRVVEIDEAYFSLSVEEQKSYLYGVDALITQMESVCIGVSTADCLPLLFYDEEKKVIAAVHAGWRGLVNGMIKHAISALTAKGSHPENLRVVIGPSIAQTSFEVGEEVVQMFLEAGFPTNIIRCHSQIPSKSYIDLWAAATFRLVEIGVRLESIQIAGVDTYTHSDSFFSARKLGVSCGRIFNGIMMLDLIKGRK